MVRTSRRQALRLLIAPTIAGLAAATTRSAGAQTAPSVRVAGTWLDITAAGYYAADMDFFKKAGLNAEVVVIANGAAAAAAIISGSLDFGCINSVALASAHENGVPFAWVAPAGAYSSQSPTAEMVTAKTSSIRTAKDCAGKTMSVVLLKQLADIALRSWLDANGVDLASVKTIEMPYSAMDAALASGRIDVACIEEPVLSQTLASNGRLLATGYDAIAKQFGEAAWVCSADYAKAHPDVVRKFSDIIAATNAWANKNHDQTAKILEKYGKQTLPAGMHRCFYPERLRAGDFQPVIDAALKYGVIKSGFRAGELFAPGIG
jgi:NitT/TauT family transport system substrate-binding protein